MRKLVANFADDVFARVMPKDIDYDVTPMDDVIVITRACVEFWNRTKLSNTTTESVSFLDILSRSFIWLSI